ncbi:MAG TPA: hypothetical protein VFJ78_03980 [Gaiellaceae bacterium]|nr:hypothetical protein [Gaiellaceae bacterium]
MATPTIAAQKLGKLPVRTDVRTLALARYLDRTKLPDPPATFDEATNVHDWPMYRNDRIGDCTVAAAAHMIEAWTGAHGAPVELGEQVVLDTFDRVKITDPFTGEEGAVVLDLLKLWRDPGIGGHRIGAFARLSVHDHQLVRAAAWLFGGLYLGVQLPETAQQQATWDWTGQLNGPARPGSWGGHAVDVVRYDESALTVVTWGALKELTWAFWDRYVDEAYCILAQDFLEGDRAPNGFDLEALKADLALITA